MDTSEITLIQGGLFLFFAVQTVALGLLNAGKVWRHVVSFLGKNVDDSLKPRDGGHLIEDGFENISIVEKEKDSPDVPRIVQGVAELGFWLILAFMCEYRPPWGHHGTRTWSRDDYWFQFAVLIIVSSCFIRKTSSSALINREQTDEWKGWMQFAFVSYHYFAGAELYNFIRVLVSAYLWMTGFGNVRFFLSKKDFSFMRIYRMLWRMNFLVLFLCGIMNNSYILYYISALHSFHFLIVYLTLFIFKGHNSSHRILQIKFIVLAVLISVVWNVPGVFDYTVGLVFPPNWRHEFHFRTYLDHFTPLVGMVFAVNYDNMTTWINSIESKGHICEGVGKAVVGLFVAGGLVAWLAGLLPLEKLAYNSWHPYTALLPIIGFIFLRNLFPSWRAHHSYLLAEFGRLSLETYLMQHHMLMTSNAKTLLLLVPEYPRLNMLVTSILFIFVSGRMKRLTEVLAELCIPSDWKGALINLGVLLGLIGSLSVAGLFISLAPAIFQPALGLVLVIVLAMAILWFLCPKDLQQSMSSIPVSVKIAAPALIVGLLLMHSSMSLVDRVDSNSNTSVRLAAMPHGECARLVASAWDWKASSFDAALAQECRFTKFDTASTRTLLAGKRLAFITGKAGDGPAQLFRDLAHLVSGEEEGGVNMKRLDKYGVSLALLYEAVEVEMFLRQESAHVYIIDSGIAAAQLPTCTVEHRQPQILQFGKDLAYRLAYRDRDREEQEQESSQGSMHISLNLIALSKPQRCHPASDKAEIPNIGRRLLAGNASVAQVNSTKAAGDKVAAPVLRPKTVFVGCYPLRALMVVGIILLMLLTQDNYYGSSHLGLWAANKAHDLYSQQLIAVHQRKESSSPTEELAHQGV